MLEIEEKVLISLHEEIKKGEPISGFIVNAERFGVGNDLFEQILIDLEKDGYIYGLERIKTPDKSILYFNRVKLTSVGKRYIKEIENK